MSSRPEVSVVVPAYNRAHVIRATLDSVLDQTFQDFEVIVIDDGSTDDTGKVVLDIGDDRIRYHRQENSGLPASARNAGIRRARGRYVAFLDSDDLWLPEKLDAQIARFHENPDAGLVYCDAVYFGDSVKNGQSLIRTFSEGRIFQDLLAYNPIPTLTAVVRTECLDAAGQFSEAPEIRSAEDYHLWLRIAWRFPVYAVRRVLARYRVHDTNLTANVGPYVAGVHAIRDVAREFGLAPRTVDRAIATRYAELAWSRYKLDDLEGFDEACRSARRYGRFLPLTLFRMSHLALGHRWTMRMMQRAGFS